MAIIFSMFFSFIIFIIMKRAYVFSGVKLSGYGVHPFSIFIIIQFCIFSFPGVIAISFLNYYSARYDGITNSVLTEVGMWYLYSIFIFLLINVLSLKFFKISNYEKLVSSQINQKKIRKDFIVFTLLTCIILIVEMAFSKKPPIFYLLLGQSDLAYLARIDIQINPSDYYLPYVSNLVNFYLVFQFYFVFYHFTFLNKKTYFSRFVLLISFIAALFQSLYETQKAPVILLMVGAIFIFYLKNPKIIKPFIVLLVVVIFLVLLQAIISSSDLIGSFTSIIDRVLLGQNQGFYHIINSIQPNEKYWYSSFYFIERLGVIPSRADIDVIPYLDVYKNTDIVNVNSYYLGEAWSMFGYYGLVISPFIVAVVVALFVKIIDLLIGFSPYYFIPYAIYIVPEFRINQSFTYFLYGKEFVFKLLMMMLITGFIYLLKNITYTTKLAKK